MTRRIVVTACLLAASACVAESEHERHERSPVVERQYDPNRYEDRRDQRREELHEERHDDFDRR